MSVVSGGAVQKARAMANENGYKGVKSTLCYGVQWDETLNFIDSNYITSETVDGKPNCSSDSYLVNSKGKGWYIDNESNNTQHKTGIDVDSNSTNKVKNIYDMAGNVGEWIMESHTATSRVRRGGRYNGDVAIYPASLCDSYASSDNRANVGFRVTLYLQ